MVYYNEYDKFSAAWLRELIAAGHIAFGIVDERSIEDVLPAELIGYKQWHFFAGIGVWSYALRRAGWPDDRPVVTGSCPCQPFSAAGKGDGFADERHLWPAFYHLIEHLDADVVFGEQVASKDGLAWLDLVLSDLEGAGYTAGAVDTCNPGFGAPHIRQRLYWMADMQRSGLQGGLPGRAHSGREYQHGHTGCDGSISGVGNALNSGRQLEPNGARSDDARMVAGRWKQIESGKDVRRISGLGDTEHDGRVAATLAGSDGQTILHNTGGAHDTEQLAGAGRSGDVPVTSATVAARPTNGHWRDADWLFCRDGKWRPVESGTFPLVAGAPARVGRLRGYGNALNAEAATAFIEAYLDVSRIPT